MQMLIKNSVPSFSLNFATITFFTIKTHLSDLNPITAVEDAKCNLIRCYQYLIPYKKIPDSIS